MKPAWILVNAAKDVPRLTPASMMRFFMDGPVVEIGRITKDAIGERWEPR